MRLYRSIHSQYSLSGSSMMINTHRYDRVSCTRGDEECVRVEGHRCDGADSSSHETVVVTDILKKLVVVPKESQALILRARRDERSVIMNCECRHLRAERGDGLCRDAPADVPEREEERRRVKRRQ